ncbi:MAG TPA: alpha/beta fold hydrolase [Ramlibacter sp.]|jgi:alpha-beta hydrolase superfamily lysophospholipase|uniref:alpha/beta hydrolase n=1 Tax=Ramlibacter sp. TaxID=1917967 RepID=UPI002D6D61BB|nr:alpha/beta fold hydrolase [Ramlibacter sp.]HZY19545.1 alpha/beta fold hydrolase [Ramlibacter sp.]
MKRVLAATLVLLTALLSWGCATLDEKQRAWIFQPSDRAWGGSASYAEGMDDVWIAFDSRVTGSPAKLHGLWLEADDVRADTPVLLYLHGARWNVSGSAGRMRRMQELGFSVLAIDYRGFGKSSGGLPSEEMAYEDARAAWEWLRQHHPERPRYVFGHSLGGAIAIDLASRVADEKGTIVEGTFTSIPDVASSFKWGWLPIGPLITQRFSSIDKVSRIGSPLLVVHGAADSLIDSTLGQRLFDAATGKKRFVLVEGGSHHSTMMVGRAKYQEAVQQLFSLR